MPYTGLVATITDVARLAGVSPTTAKRAIRSPELLAPETLERVQRAIRELNYEPDKLASALRSGRPQTVGLVVGSILEPFFAELTRNVQRALRRAGYTLLVAENEYDHQLELDVLREFHGNRVGGIILRPGYGGHNLGYLEKMRARGTAVVEIDYHYPGSPFSHVLLDNAGAVAQVVRHLHGLGHERIAYVGTVTQPGQPEERYEGFLAAISRAGLPLPEAYHRLSAPYPHGLTEADAYAVTVELLRLPEPPSAIFAFNGACTAGAFRALRDASVAIPHDLSLVGFDDYTWTRLVSPSIDVVAQPTEAMALAAVELLLERLHQSNDAAESTPVHRRFPGELLVRGSSAPPRTASPTSLA